MFLMILNLFKFVHLKNMVGQIQCSVILILTTILIFYLWGKPKKTMKFYEKQLRTTNYTFKIMPYRFMYNGCFDPLVQGIKKGQPYITYMKDYQGYDVVISNAFYKPLVEICHIDFIKDFFSVDKHYTYPKIKMISRPIARLVGGGLGFTEGLVWKQKRNILNHVLNFQFLKSQIPNIVKVCDFCIEQMEKKCSIKQDQSGKYVQTELLQDLMIKIFSQIVLQSFLGIKNKEYIDGIEVSQFLNEAAVNMMTHQLKSPTAFLGDWFYDMQFRKIDKKINSQERKLKEWGINIVKKRMKQIQEQLKENKEKFVIDDIIKSFIIYKKNNNLQDQNPLVSANQIFTHLLGFFLGGTDTTANYLNMMMTYIAKYPHVQQKVRDQVNLYMKQDNYSYENLKNFKYIEAIQKQTTRMYGPGNIILVRQAIQDNYINGLAIKKGTWVTVPSIPNHYSQKYFKQPFQFRPERWLNGECDGLDSYVVIGFSAGARACPGKHLALLESKIGMIKMLKRYKKIQIPKMDFKMSFKFLQCPEQFKTKLVLNQ